MSGLALAVHGESGSGKSWFADTAPTPRLIFDVEGGVEFTPSRKVEWDPRLEPPKVDGTWDTAVVTVQNDVDVVRRASQWLQTGQHPFESVAVDSLTEYQERVINQIAGTSQPTQQNYGELWRGGRSFVRFLCDLKKHPVKPVQTVVFICETAEDGPQERSVMRPALVGKLRRKLAYTVDAMGYMFVTADGAELTHHLQFTPVNNIAAKDRTGKLGVVMDDPTVTKILETVYDGPQPWTGEAEGEDEG